MTDEQYRDFVRSFWIHVGVYASGAAVVGLIAAVLTPSMFWMAFGFTSVVTFAMLLLLGGVSWLRKHGG